MFRPPWAHLPILPLAIALLPSFHLCHAQTPSAPPSEFLLKVVSAKYIPDKEVIEYKLQNEGTSSVSAYSIDVSAFADDKETTELGEGFGMDQDLLTSELFLQCRNAPENADDEDARPWSDELTLPAGLIPPGKLRVKSIPVGPLLDQSLLSATSPVIRIVVTGVIWADGRIEGTPMGVGTMQRIRDWWDEADREGEQVSRVLKADAENANDQNWINNAIEHLESLTKGYPREVPVPEDESAQTMYVSEPGGVSSTIQTLNEAAYLPNPKGRITFVSEMADCARHRRAELQVPPRAAVPARKSRQRSSTPCPRRRVP